MKTFIAGFILSAAICLGIGQFIRQDTARLRASAASPATAGPTTSPSTPVPTASAAGIWQFLQQSRRADKDNPHRPLDAAQWAALDAIAPKELVMWVKAQKPDPRDSLWQAAVHRWAADDGPAALAFAKTLRDAHPRTGDCACCGGDPGGQFDALVLDVFATWLRRDPAAALASGEPTIAPGAIADNEPIQCETLAQTDFSRSLDQLAAKHTHLASTPFLILGNNLHLDADAYGSQLDDPARLAEFTAWLGRCSDQKVASTVFSRVFSRARHQGAWLRPERLPAFMPGRDQVPDNLEDPAMIAVMGALAMGADPLASLAQYRKNSGVMAWQREFDKDNLASWAYRDPESATIWLHAQTASPILDQAIVGYLDGIWRASPEAAVKWAGRITRAGTRLRECAQYYPRWHRVDPEAATAWLAGSGLPEVHRHYIAGQVGNRL